MRDIKFLELEEELRVLKEEKEKESSRKKKESSRKKKESSRKKKESRRLMEEEISRLKAQLELRNNSKTSDVTSNIDSAAIHGNYHVHICEFNLVVL
jgi:hypothetical protein